MQQHKADAHSHVLHAPQQSSDWAQGEPEGNRQRARLLRNNPTARLRCYTHFMQLAHIGWMRQAVKRGLCRGDAQW